MSHLSEILDQQSWLTTAATDISQTLPAEIERRRKWLEREAIERKERAGESADVARAGMSLAPAVVLACNNPLPDEIGIDAGASAADAGDKPCDSGPK